MNARHRFIALSLLVSAPLAISSAAQAASFDTLIFTPLAIEGLTNDSQGNLYTPARGGSPCPVYRVNIANPSLVVVGNIPAPCSPSGLAFNRAGRLFVSQGNTIVSFIPNANLPPTATVFAMGVPGTNGLAFDRAGNLWTGDGTTGQGRVWKISPAGAVTEVFRVQPMANDVIAGGIGRDVRTLPPGTITITPTSRSASNTDGSQPLVANGFAFDKEGNLFIADTARGAIWKVSFEPSGALRSQTGCDTTFTPNTLCLENIFVQHSLLDGVDGIALDEEGNIWVSANERNAMVVVSKQGEVTEVFRNPPDATSKLRNGGPLETPTSPALSDLRLCTANSDGGRRDNAPPSGGELPAFGLGKISCMIERLQVRGIPLPVR
jgi:sugar lactone lactonase YvrE